MPTSRLGEGETRDALKNSSTETSDKCLNERTGFASNEWEDQHIGLMNVETHQLQRRTYGKNLMFTFISVNLWDDLSASLSCGIRLLRQ